MLIHPTSILLLREPLGALRISLLSSAYVAANSRQPMNIDAAEFSDRAYIIDALINARERSHLPNEADLTIIIRKRIALSDVSCAGFLKTLSIRVQRQTNCSVFGATVKQWNGRPTVH